VAVVKRATHLLDGTKVAVKCCYSDDEEVHTFARREYELLSSLCHASIIHVDSFHANGHQSLMVVELMEGLSVKSHVEKHGPFGEASAVHLWGQLLQAVDYLHMKRIVHRDVKPDNMLLDAEANTLKLIDFNSATRIGCNLVDGPMLSHRGTELFRSPEQLMGLVWNERVDIWACGLCLYFAVQGGLPFARAGMNTKEMFAAGSVPDVCWVGLSLDIQHLLRQSLAIDMQDRPPAMEMLNHPAFIHKLNLAFDEELMGLVSRQASSGPLSRQVSKATMGPLSRQVSKAMMGPLSRQTSKEPISRQATTRPLSRQVSKEPMGDMTQQATIGPLSRQESKEAISCQESKESEHGDDKIFTEAQTTREVSGHHPWFDAYGGCFAGPSSNFSNFIKQVSPDSGSPGFASQVSTHAESFSTHLDADYDCLSGRVLKCSDDESADWIYAGDDCFDRQLSNFTNPETTSPSSPLLPRRPGHLSPRTRSAQRLQQKKLTRAMRKQEHAKMKPQDDAEVQQENVSALWCTANLTSELAAC
jgi:serine/threonine protein kinase